MAFRNYRARPERAGPPGRPAHAGLYYASTAVSLRTWLMISISSLKATNDPFGLPLITYVRCHICTTTSETEALVLPVREFGTVSRVACEHLTSATNILNHYWRHTCLTRPRRFVTFYISALEILLLTLLYLLVSRTIWLVQVVCGLPAGWCLQTWCLEQASEPALDKLPAFLA